VFVLVTAIDRKSAVRVKSGRVAKKNNWTPDAKDYYALPQREIHIERTEPGRGYRHVVTVAQLRRFLEILPDWDELAVVWRRYRSIAGTRNGSASRPPAWS
jgi:hypothetical protein